MPCPGEVWAIPCRSVCTCGFAVLLEAYCPLGIVLGVTTAFYCGKKAQNDDSNWQVVCPNNRSAVACKPRIQSPANRGWTFGRERAGCPTLEPSGELQLEGAMATLKVATREVDARSRARIHSLQAVLCTSPGRCKPAASMAGQFASKHASTRAWHGLERRGRCRPLTTPTRVNLGPHGGENKTSSVAYLVAG